MPISEQTLITLCLAGILQAALLALVILFYPKGERSVNAFLAAYVVAFSLPICAPVILHFSTWQNAILLRSTYLLLGPTLYFYGLSFRELITLRKAWPHFVPFLVQLALDLQLYFNTTAGYPPGNLPPHEVVTSPAAVALFVFRILQMVFYYFLCWRSLVHYRKVIRQLYSETSRISLSWLRWLNNGNLVLVLVITLLYPFVLSHPDKFMLFGLLNVCALIPYVYLATFKGITQPTLWQMKPGLSEQKVKEEIRAAESVEIDEAASRKKPMVSEEKSATIVSRAIALMENEKLFRTADLSLQELAERIDVPAYLVSQAINDNLKKNFYDLVNGYRVAEAKRLLLSPASRKHKIIALAYDSGFNSKTTFNTVFKKFTGHSPTEFRERQPQ